eukprot:EG_transcript_16233
MAAAAVAPFLRQAAFLEEEKDAPLLEKDGGFLQGQGEAMFCLTEDWPDLVQAAEASRLVGEVSEGALSEDVLRIIEKDAERTFAQDSHRQALMRIMRALAVEFRNYAQAMSYVCGFLMLTHDEGTCAAMMRVLNNEPKYIPGYWTTEAIAFATDAYVFLPLLERHEPEVARLLREKFCILPETYLQKWWVALCVQALPFEKGVVFLRHFLTGGYLWLFQFALAVHRHFREPLLAAKTHAEVYAILRLEKAVLAEHPIGDDVFAQALTYEFPDLDIAAARQAAYDTHLKARIERARQMAEEDDLSDFDDEDDEDDGK